MLADPAYCPDTAVSAGAGAARHGSGPVPPAACTNQLAPRRLRVPDLTPTPCRRGQEHSSSTPRPPAGGTNPEPQKNKRHTTTRRTNHRGRCTTPRTPPHQSPGKVHAQPPLMTVESAQDAALSRGTRTHRGASSGRGSLQASRGEPGTPTARSPVPPHPPPALPRPRARSARHRRLPYRADPGTTGNRHRRADTPAAARPRPARKRPRHSERGAFRDTRTLPEDAAPGHPARASR